MKKAYKQMFITSIIATLLSWIYAILLLNSSEILRWTVFNGANHTATYNRDPNKFNTIDYNTLFTWGFLIPFMFWIITYFLKSSGASTNKSDVTINIENTTITKPKRNIFAIIGFVLSIIAMFTGFGLFAYFGMTTGIIARIKISKTEERGKGLANAAIIIGFIYGIFMSILHFFN
jgi:hypothetical protein